MLIALDFDNTYTKDPDLWNEFILKAKERGHDICIVTSRWPEIEPEVCKIIQETFTIPIHFACKRAKKQFMEESGIYVDVWIDDSPKSIIIGDGR